jgi:hypothetical protein
LIGFRERMFVVDFLLGLADVVQGCTDRVGKFAQVLCVGA